jgi:hypothetical protein
MLILLALFLLTFRSEIIVKNARFRSKPITDYVNCLMPIESAKRNQSQAEVMVAKGANALTGNRNRVGQGELPFPLPRSLQRKPSRQVGLEQK